MFRIFLRKYQRSVTQTSIHCADLLASFDTVDHSPVTWNTFIVQPLGQTSLDPPLTTPATCHLLRWFLHIPSPFSGGVPGVPVQRTLVNLYLFHRWTRLVSWLWKSSLCWGLSLSVLSPDFCWELHILISNCGLNISAWMFHGHLKVGKARTQVLVSSLTRL